MIGELDIWRAADQPRKFYGSDAAIQSAMRADKLSTEAMPAAPLLCSRLVSILLIFPLIRFSAFPGSLFPRGLGERAEWHQVAQPHSYLTTRRASSWQERAWQPREGTMGAMISHAPSHLHQSRRAANVAVTN